MTVNFMTTMILIRALVQDFIIFESYLRDDDIAGYNGKKIKLVKDKVQILFNEHIR